MGDSHQHDANGYADRVGAYKLLFGSRAS